MDRTEYDALYEDILGECVAETEDLADNEGYADYYNKSLATCEIPDYNWGSFFVDDDNYYIFLRDFNPIKSILQKSASTYMVSISLKKELQGQKLTLTYLPGQLIREFLRYMSQLVNQVYGHGASQAWYNWLRSPPPQGNIQQTHVTKMSVIKYHC